VVVSLWRTIELRILEYLSDNTDLNLKIWGQAEKPLIEEGILQAGGLMQDVREIIKEKGRQEGRQEGRKEERQQVVLTRSDIYRSGLKIEVLIGGKKPKNLNRIGYIPIRFED